jgi:hypothetical protein
MRKIILVVLASASVVTCTSPSDRSASTPSAPTLARVQDLDGTPDLIVNQHKLANSWVIYEETFSPTGCTAIEGGFKGGTHRTLRFTVSTPNIGTADVFIGDPRAHIDDGLFEFAQCHGHLHFRNYATYEIFHVDAAGTPVGDPIQARKRGFCMIDIDPYNENEPPGPWVYRSCAGNQGISVGYADTYFKWLTGQFFLLTDEEEPIGPGRYMIRITVNPPFVASEGEPCPAVDPNGKCHMFKESNYANNAAEVVITVPDRVGKTGWGPGGGQVAQQEIHPSDTKPGSNKNGN